MSENHLHFDNYQQASDKARSLAIECEATIRLQRDGHGWMIECHENYITKPTTSI